MDADAHVGMFVNKLHFPVTSLGPGRRLGIWLQGCDIRCPGCISQDTWTVDSRVHETTVEKVLVWCQHMAASGCDGVTISGGEPFQQSKALKLLLEGLRQRLPECIDVLAYSGYSLEELRKSHRAILDLLDAVITDPFDVRQAPGSVWRGSANQRLTVLSKRAVQRYRETDSLPPKFQVAVDETTVWLIGVPAPGDMQRVVRSAEGRGVRLGGVSWRA